MDKFAHALTFLFWLAVAAVLLGLWRRSRLWRAGQPAAVAWSGLFAIPKRYFVDLHHIVARDPYIANTHVATAGGAVAAIVLVAVNYGLMVYSRWLDWAIVAATVVMLAGVWFVWLRRRNPPARLSRGGWSRLPYSLAAFAVGLLVLTAVPPALLSGTIALAALLLLLAGTAELTLGIGSGGPMKHAIAGMLHLAFHPRPERFEPKLSTALKPLELERPQLGAARPLDFKWNQLLSFDACVQCGKCEAVCPAFAAGQPLNPKKLIQDLVAGMAGGSDAGYAGSPYPGRPVGQHHGALTAPIVPQLIESDTLWSCTTCRACVQACPMMIEHVDAIVEMRRNQTLVHGTVPGKGAEVLDNLRETETMGGYDLAARYNWAVDLDVRHVQPGEPVDILLMVGEGAYDMRYQRSLRALVKAMRAADLDFAVMGELERDCGDTARRLGDEATFQMLARRNIATLATLRFKRIVTADPHVMHCLRNEYPALGGQYEVLHHTTLLAQLVDNGRLHLQKSQDSRPFTYHDPCYLGRYNGEIEAPRKLLRQLGLDVREMERSGMQSRCCGGGGGAPLTDIPGKKRIPDIRIEDARKVGAKAMAVGCPGCTAMLEGVVGPRPEILDIAELVTAALEDQS